MGRRCRRCSRPIACAALLCRTASSCRRWRCTRPRTAYPTIFISSISAAARLAEPDCIFGEMTCVSPDARITPGCLGLWNDEQAAAWKRIVDFVHATTSAKFGLQLGHAGRKGSTRVAWEGIDQPLDEGNWPLISASALPYMPNSQVPRAMTRADMDRVKADFVAAARRGDRIRLRHPRTALRARLSAVELPFAADQPSHR